MTNRQPTEKERKDGHTGPICKGCGLPFYYDFIPERHEGYGYCWICFEWPTFSARLVQH